MNENQVVVEFTGISRVLTGQSECSLPLPEGADMSEVVKSIAHRYPSLLGEVIEKDGKRMIATNLFSINGEKVLHEDELDYQPKKGDHLILLSLLAGG